MPPVAPDGLPILVACSDNGTEMTATDTREFMALMAITQHHGRPRHPHRPGAHRELLPPPQGRLAAPHRITDAAALDTELARIRGDNNTRRLLAAIGYVTADDDEHHGRGAAIRRARAAGLERARAQHQAQSNQHAMTDPRSPLPPVPASFGGIERTCARGRP